MPPGPQQGSKHVPLQDLMVLLQHGERSKEPVAGGGKPKMSALWGINLEPSEKSKT